MAQFCAQCGAPLSAPSGHEARALCCSACGAFPREGPSLLVIAGVFADEKLLLIRRGIEPYRGRWAPPGGYVEAGESAEAAAARELKEEAGIEVPAADFLVTGIVSLTALNQVHIVLMAHLDTTQELRPNLPEALDAKWFAAADFPRDEVWMPYLSLKTEMLYWPSKHKRFRFVHQTDMRRRVISTDAGLSHPWTNVTTD